MHPSRLELEAFVEGRAPNDIVGQHVRDCEFCSDYCARYRLLLESVDSAEAAEPAELAAAALRIFEGRVKVISLAPLVSEPSPLRLLAADGEPEPVPTLQNLATWYSREQDIVVRVMRDNLKGLDLLQVVAPNESLMAHVLLESVDSRYAYVTDSLGKVEIATRQIEDIAVINWQIKLPEAVFRLDPMTYDPERITSEADTILNSAGGDSISVKLLNRVEGKEIVVSVLALDGNDRYPRARVAITSRSGTEVKAITPNDSLRFTLIDAGTEIGIRIFE